MATTPPRRRLPRRDLLILPLLALITAVALFAGAEVAARMMMPVAEADRCLVADPVLGQRPRPNCASRTKSAEGEWVDNRYNDCGYRSDTSCRAPLNARPRLVALGSSSSWGYHVPTRETWYVRARDTLAARCGVDLDVQNLSGVFDLAQIASRATEAVALRPAAVVTLLAPFDLEKLPDRPFSPATANAGAGGAPAPPPPPSPGALKTLQTQLTGLRAVTAAQHFMFRQPASYVPLYLRYGDKADFLRPPFTPAWRRRLAYADAALGYIAARVHAAGASYVLVYTPQEAQADMVSAGLTAPGVDPYAMGRAVGAIARRHGIVFADLTGSFAGRRDAPDLFLNVDGHLNGRGSALPADAVVAALTGPGGPAALRACRR